MIGWRKGDLGDYETKGVEILSTRGIDQSLFSCFSAISLCHCNFLSFLQVSGENGGYFILDKISPRG